MQYVFNTTSRGFGAFFERWDIDPDADHRAADTESRHHRISDDQRQSIGAGTEFWTEARRERDERQLSSGRELTNPSALADVRVGAQTEPWPGIARSLENAPSAGILDCRQPLNRKNPTWSLPLRNFSAASCPTTPARDNCPEDHPSFERCRRSACDVRSRCPPGRVAMITQLRSAVPIVLGRRRRIAARSAKMKVELSLQAFCM